MIMELIFEPQIGLGPLKFGMPRSETELLRIEISGIVDCDYQDEKLSAFTINPIDVKHLVFAGEDLLKMDKLKAALYLAEQSINYGQAQGGSLYFMDLGCAVLQFESPSREFLFFSSNYDAIEVLKDMSPYSIKSYYEDNTWDWDD